MEAVVVVATVAAAAVVVGLSRAAAKRWASLRSEIALRVGMTTHLVGG